MNRRNFLKNGATASVLSTLSFSAAALPLSLTESGDTDFKANFELNETTIDELQSRMRSGNLSSKSITKMYLKRIAEIDKGGPKLNSVIELNPDALAIAIKMDEERKQGKTRGPLHGIPILIKDNINTGDKMQTTAGSLALLGNIASADAFIIKKIYANLCMFV